MAVSVERRSDGSVALFINGDLQFDSTDERIYHEALVLPALALAQRRRESGLRALVIGGGDGLVARELFKSSAIQHLDLVDFDSRILALAKGEFSDLNSCSMQDPRLTTHVMDAWEFVDEAVGQPKFFDLIVCDLTVAEDVDGARFHSIEWYEQLHKLLGSAGILAVNAVSPQGTPEAYWSAFNSALTSGLHVRPYHISLPSFAARSYGADWGFMLASPLAITVEEFDAKLTLAEPTYTLMDLGQVRELFCLPEELFQYQATSLPAQAGSSILLHYFRYCSRITETSGATRDALLMDVQDLVVPAPDNGANLLPPGLSAAVATCLEYNSSQENADESKREMEDRLVMSVLNLVPALQQFQTRDIVADFVRDPAAFLQSIDLHGLVASLLQRAAELPEQLVAELEVLRDHLSDWAGDYDSLLRLGQRVVTVLTVVVVLGNLLYPDSAYAKGDGGHGGAGHHDGGGRGDHGGDRGGDRGDRGGDRGDRVDRGFHGDHGAFARGGYGYGGYRGFWGHNWGGYGWARPWHGFYDNYVPPVYVGTNQWSQTNVGPDQYVDETGTSYPARQYRYNQTNVQTTVNNVSNQAPNNAPSNSPSSDADDQSNGGTNAVYKLSDGADILANGQTAIPLTDQSYLMITPSGTQVMDQTTGEPIMWLYNDPALMHQTAIEIRRQEHRLNFAIRRAQGQGGNSGANDGSDSGDAPANPAALARMQATSDQLRNALDALGPVPTDKMISDVPPPVPGAIEAFASVWMTADGKYLAIKRTNGNISYLDANGWYSDLGKTKLPEPYPTKFKNVAIAYLTTLVSDADATKSKLESDTNEGSNHIDILNRELSDYQTPDGSPTDMVDFGSRKLQRSEAIRLTQLGITRTNSKLSDLQQQIDQMPAEIELAKKELQSLNAGG